MPSAEDTMTDHFWTCLVWTKTAVVLTRRMKEVLITRMMKIWGRKGRVTPVLIRRRKVASGRCPLMIAATLETNQREGNA